MFAVMFFQTLVLLLLPNLVLGIIGGRRQTDTYPFYVMIANGGFRICGGTIIAPRAILTAASCLYDYDRKQYLDVHEIEVIKSDFTHEDWQDFMDVHSCCRFVVHPTFDPEVFQSPFDLAILKLGNFSLQHTLKTLILHRNSFCNNFGFVSFRLSKVYKRIMFIV